MSARETTEQLPRSAAQKQWLSDNDHNADDMTRQHHESEKKETFTKYIEKL